MTNHSGLFVRVVVYVALFSIFVNFAGCGPAPSVKKTRPAPMVVLEEAKVSDLIQVLPLTGEVRAIEIARISSTVDGVIGRFDLRESDRADEGDVVVEIHRDTLRAEVLSAEASLEVARAKLADLSAGTRPEEIDKAMEAVTQHKESMDFAAKDLERIEMLVKSGAIPSEDLEKARVRHVGEKAKYSAARRQLDMLKAGLTITAIGVQRAVVKESEAKLEMARARLAECTVKAPFSGVITKTWAKKGDLAAVKAPLFELVNMSSLIVRCSVPEKFSTDLSEGMPAAITIDALPGEVFAAEVARIFPELDEKMRTRTIELQVKNSTKLMPGMFARVNLQLKKLPGVLSVPVQSVRKRPDGSSFVFSVADKKAQAHNVEVGQIINNRYHLINGITAGQKIVTEGNEKLKDGAEVRVPGAGPSGKKGDQKGQQEKMQSGGKAK